MGLAPASRCSEVSPSGNTARRRIGYNAVMRSIVFALALAVAMTAAAQEHPFVVTQKANAAYDAGRYAEAAELYARVTQLLPRSPSSRINAARALARSAKNEEALAQLETAVSFGVRFDADDEAWKALRDDARFARLVSKMRSRTAPVVRSTVAYRLAKNLIPENVAFDPKTRSFFVGSMYQAKIVRIAPDGMVTDFVPSRRDGLLGVLGMKVDAARRELWAAAGNFGITPPMEFEDPASAGRGALFRFNADTGKMIRAYWGPGTAEKPVQFNDLVITPGGDVYATAGLEGIWRVRAGSDTIEPFLQPPGSFFNGIALTPDGATLFAASHFEGVLRIDVATKSAAFLDLPPGAALGGIDGLYVHENSLVAIQNGTDPIRVLRAWMNPERTRVTRVAVLEQGHPETDIPLTGTIVGDDLYYIGRSQLRAFDGPKIWPDEKLKETTILKLPLELVEAPAADLEAERHALLELHRAEIRAHVERDAEALARDHGDDFVSATRGKITRSTKDETRKFFTGYFRGATYPQYEDAEPPIVRVSDDGSMGWVLSRTRVRRVDASGESGFVYAGMMAYEKRDGRWVRVGNASTFE